MPCSPGSPFGSGPIPYCLVPADNIVSAILAMRLMVSSSVRCSCAVLVPASAVLAEPLPCLAMHISSLSAAVIAFWCTTDKVLRMSCGSISSHSDGLNESTSGNVLELSSTCCQACLPMIDNMVCLSTLASPSFLLRPEVEAVLPITGALLPVLAGALLPAVSTGALLPVFGVEPVGALLPTTGALLPVFTGVLLPEAALAARSNASRLRMRS